MPFEEGSNEVKNQVSNKVAARKSRQDGHDTIASPHFSLRLSSALPPRSATGS